MTENKYWPFMGGHLEQRPAGMMTVQDEMTGQPKEVSWKNHIQVKSKAGRAKLTREIIEAIVKYYQEDPDFREWVDQCLP